MEKAMRARSLDGIVLLDKPKGIRSLDVDLVVKRRLDAHKVGHAGTLDPDVSGLLPIGINRATRFLRFLPPLKVYEVEFEGEFKWPPWNFSHFPPPPAAAKSFRTRKIYWVKRLGTNKVEVGVEAGLYVRALAHFMNWRLIGLRRVRVGLWYPEVGLEEFLQHPTDYIHPIDDFVWFPMDGKGYPRAVWNNGRLRAVRIDRNKWYVFGWNK